MELNREYKLGVRIMTVAEIVSDALVLPARPRRRGDKESHEPAELRTRA
jgi:hypothetical protein